MDHAGMARQIVEGVGGAANIALIDHCMTRLRLTVTDIAKVDVRRIQSIPGVLGTMTRGGQFQVVLAEAVVPVSAQVRGLMQGDRSPAVPDTPTGPDMPAAPATANRYDRLAAVIIDNVGGAGNVKALEHCSTRLRFTLADPGRTKVDTLKRTEGILGVVTAAQTQVIIGNDVVEVFRAIQRAFPKLGMAASADAGKVQGVGAILRVEPHGVASIMVPMVASVSEMVAVRAIVEEERRALGRSAPIQVGAMIEIPAAAVAARQLAELCDFFSVGTNDLTQYALAMDRGNPAVAASVDALHPGVLGLIRIACEGAAARGRRPVAVCGSAASDPVAAPILVGLGVTELSVAPAAIPEIKATLSALSLNQCKALADRALAAADPDGVRSLSVGQ